MEEEMKPYYAPGYSGHSSIKTIILKDGRRKHTMEGWIGYTNPNESMAKTKWLKTDTEYHEVQGTNSIYIVQKDSTGKVSCQCKGFQFRKKCKHILELTKELV